MSRTILRSWILICAGTLTFATAMAVEPSGAQPAPNTASPTGTTPQASATAPASTANGPTATSQPTKTDNAAAQSPDAKSGKVVLTDDTITDAQLKRILAKGYKPEGRGNQVRYCRREAILGSHFEQKACRSAQQIMDEERDSQEMTDRAQRTHPSTTGR